MSFEQKLRFITLSLTIASLVFLLAQCSIGNPLPVLVGKKIWLGGGENRLKKELRQHISVGSSIGDAKNLLQFNGFRCSYHGTPEQATPINPLIKERDYLFCYIETPDLFICSKSYKPFIYYRDNKVTNVDAAIGGWCL
ncbi:hypothetical protein ACQ4M3_30825 [Leptolyngbya sp. AN03gr2]|uniref:hypothetical protein n=1 Tax=unclassified Leptolyngbya TaxID=2650499 RepID=UPI003D3190F2